MRNLIGRTLGHYSIVEQIGEGGMGEVYRARDERLDRDVAVKVLPEEVAGDSDRLRRFESEAKAVAQLDHPNILAVHDFRTEDGVAYAVMELLEGESLRELISKGSITTGKAVEYARAIADGLAAAHEKHIIHRDLKPENVFLTKDGRIKVLDFGLAKLKLPEADLTTETPTATLDTEPGGLIGTVPYMAPEQVQGQPADHRSDIFALGAVLYEMLTGHRPFGGSTTVETAAAILKEDPEPISVAAPAVSPALCGVASKCLEKRPEDRFSSANDLSLTLGAIGATGSLERSVISKRWPFILATVIAAAIALFFVFRPEGLFERSVEKAGEATVPRIVVLPFENLGSPDDDYFADGMTDEVRGRLTSLLDLEVIARTSAVQYRNTTKPAAVIASELGVSYLLMSRVRWQKSGARSNRIRVTSELVEVSSSGVPVSRWQESFDAQIQDVFRVQATIATRVAQGLRVTLAKRERELLSKIPTADLTAYDSLLRADAYTDSFTRSMVPVSALRKAITHYEQAVNLDPSFALAWARLSRARTLVFINGARLLSDSDKARTAAERSVSIAPDLPDAWHAIGYYHLLVQSDAVRARKEFEAGLALSPGDADLLSVLGLTQIFQGNWADGLSTLERARSLDPRSAYATWLLGRAHLRMRNYTEALALLDQALARDPELFEAIRDKIRAFIAQGDLTGARRVVSDVAARVDPTLLVSSVAKLGWVLDEDRQQLLLRLSPTEFDDDQIAWGVTLADTHACRGELNQARRYANEAHEAYVKALSQKPDWRTVSFDALALAYLGRRDDAVREGQRSVAMVPINRDAYSGPGALWTLAIIYIIVEEHDKALDTIEKLLDIPCEISPGWLIVDPHVDPLRDHPRFQALLEEYDTN